MRPADGVAGGEEDAGAIGAGAVAPDLHRVDVEQRVKLGLPLAEQGLRRDDQDALGALRAQLRDHEPRLDGLPEADLIGEDAVAIGDARQREDDGIDLVRIRIDPRAALGGELTPVLVGAPAPDEVLDEEQAMEEMEPQRGTSCGRGPTERGSTNRRSTGRGMNDFISGYRSGSIGVVHVVRNGCPRRSRNRDAR